MPLLELIPFAPDTSSLDLLCRNHLLTTESGQPLRFVPPQADGLGYEARIWSRGEVETRPDNWHDFFNALVWMSFPRAKTALNTRHARSFDLQQAGRGTARDAMTHFDECGVVVVSSDASLLELLRNFCWKDLFWHRRDDLRTQLRCFIFGHATYEQLLAPFRGLTAKAVLLEVPPNWLAEPLSAQMADIDQRLAAALAVGACDNPRSLHPLPLMGFPSPRPVRTPPISTTPGNFAPGGDQANAAYNPPGKSARQPLGQERKLNAERKVRAPQSRMPVNDRAL